MEGYVIYDKEHGDDFLEDNNIILGYYIVHKTDEIFFDVDIITIGGKIDNVITKMKISKLTRDQEIDLVEFLDFLGYKDDTISCIMSCEDENDL